MGDLAMLTATVISVLEGPKSELKIDQSVGAQWAEGEDQN